MKNKKQLITIIASLLPVVAFAIFEEVYGTKAGLIAGIVLAVGELLFEWKTLGRPQGITIATNVLVLALGALSLYESDPVFFKLQPAIMIFAFAAMLVGSSLLGRPFMVELLKKQRPDLNEMGIGLMRGLNLRLGIFLIFAAVVGVHAAYAWPTGWWAAYKAIGLPVAVIGYVLVDILIWKRIYLSRNNAPKP